MYQLVKQCTDNCIIFDLNNKIPGAQKSTHLRTELVNFGRLTIVEPSIVKHQVNVIDELPRMSVASGLQLTTNSRQVHRILNDIMVILKIEVGQKKLNYIMVILKIEIGQKKLNYIMVIL